MASKLPTMFTKLFPVLRQTGSRHTVLIRSIARRITTTAAATTTPETAISRQQLSTRASLRATSQPEIDYNKLITVRRSPDDVRTYNATWLRENCRCESCYNADTDQRRAVLHQLKPETLSPDHVTVADAGARIEITWADGHRSVYDADWLERAATVAPSTVTGSSIAAARYLWDGSLRVDEIPPVEYRELVSSDERSRRSLKQLVGQLIRFGFAFVDGSPASLEATLAATNKIGFSLRTFFGADWEFGVGLEFNDTAYTNDEIGLHTDGTYFTTPPALQILHLLRHTGGSGGETLLVDGFHVAEQLRRLDPDSFHLLTTTRLEHQYLEARRQLAYRSHNTILRTTQHGDAGHMEWIRYNPYDRAPIRTLPQDAQGNIYRALTSLGRLVDDDGAAIRFRLSPGRIMFMDNWRVLHGRTAFSGRRQLCGCYMPRDEWLNDARYLGLIDG